jgi:hypothetical protein
VGDDESIGVRIGGGLMEESAFNVGGDTFSSGFKDDYSDESLLFQLLFPDSMEGLLDEVELKRDN